MSSLYTNKINLYKKLLGFLIKKGNKVKAKKILDKTFFILSKKTKMAAPILLIKLFKILNVFVETKTISLRRRKQIVPFSIGLKRRSYLIIKWLMEAVKKNRQQIPIHEKIVIEILLVIKNSNSYALKMKNINNSQALSNRSNLHFRW